MVISTLDRRTLPAHRSSRAHRPVLRVDIGLVLGSVALALFGALMVYTATRSTLAEQGIDPKYYLNRQLLFIVLGVVAMVVMSLIDYRRLEQVAFAIYGVIIFSLIVVLSPIGSHALGSQRWFSLGPLQIQPSEFAVLAMILAVGTYCSRRSEGLTWSDVLKVLVLAAIPIGLVMIQPDLGTALIMLVVLIVMLAVAGLPARILLLLLVGMVLVVLVAVEGGFLQAYQISRLTSFLQQDVRHPSYVQQASIYNLQQAKIAIASGGLWGKGIGHGTQTNLGYVPEQQTDFIFTAVGEQLGFVGCTAVLAVQAFVAWRFLRTAALARNAFGRLLCTGMFAFLAFSVFQNAGMTMGIMPITGIPLPFLSYGGSAIFVYFIGVGICLNVYAQRGR